MTLIIAALQLAGLMGLRHETRLWIGTDNYVYRVFTLHGVFRCTRHDRSDWLSVFPDDRFLWEKNQ